MIYLPLSFINFTLIQLIESLAQQRKNLIRAVCVGFNQVKICADSIHFIKEF